MTMETNLNERAGSLADRNFVAVDTSSTVADAARLMMRNKVTSVLVTRGGLKTPVGIFTEKDILYKIVAQGKGPYKVTVGEIMSSPLITVREDTSVKEAVALMSAKSIRRVAVVSGDNVIGMLALEDVASEKFGKAQDAQEEPKNAEQCFIVKCPYCESQFKDKIELSRHIDRLHLGAGLLEGDVRQL